MRKILIGVMVYRAYSITSSIGYTGMRSYGYGDKGLNGASEDRYGRPIQGVFDFHERCVPEGTAQSNFVQCKDDHLQY